MQGKKRTDAEKLEIIKYYEENGAEKTGERYGLGGHNSTISSISKARKDSNMQVTRCFSDEEKLNIVKYYEEKGPEETSIKFNIKYHTVFSYVKAFIKQLNIKDFKGFRNKKKEKLEATILENGGVEGAIKSGVRISYANKVARKNGDIKLERHTSITNEFIINEFHKVYLEKITTVQAAIDYINGHQA